MTISVSSSFPIQSAFGGFDVHLFALNLPQSPGAKITGADAAQTLLFLVEYTGVLKLLTPQHYAARDQIDS